MKLYIDWNILNEIRKGNFKDIKEIIEQNENFVLLYSSAHISDIASSYSNEIINEEIEKDLEFLSNVTNNVCLFNNGEEIAMGFYNPFYFFEQEIKNNTNAYNFSLENLIESFNNIEDHKIIEKYKETIKLLCSIPIFNELFNNPQTDIFNTIFPKLKENPTMGGFFNSFGEMAIGMNEKETYKDLKNQFKHLNTNIGKLNSLKNNPFTVLIEAYKKLGIDDNPLEKEYFEKGKYTSVWFDEITEAYIKLDMHGFYSDDIKVNKKNKKTFRNTTIDAFHTAFASTCDIYLTIDNKNYHKSKAVYKNNNIFTYVFKPDEFIYFYEENIKNTDFNSSWIKFNEVLKSQIFYDISKKENPFDFQKIVYTNYYYFGYFNRLYIFNSDENKNSFSIQFGKELPSNCLGVFYKEIIKMVKIIVDKLGLDINNKGYFDEAELDENKNWKGRKWNFENIQFRLVQNGRYFQFYYDFYMDYQ